ncbi:MAG: nicotinamide mononucleotide transporter, partial [Crocinitomicaceae bacterium]|nr:nicotinamide mononucleotide transporter [Crocinitomicaceae bacterium]
KLYADVFLQFFYILFAVYGWLTIGSEWISIEWGLSKHIPLIMAGLLFTVASGFFLKKKTDAKLTYIDSFTTAFGIIGTWVMVNYVHENWLYFIVINLTSAYMYTRRKMYLGALMFVFYFVMSLDGYFQFGIFYP